MPPLYMVDARDPAGPIYRHDEAGTTIAFTWGLGTIYSLATDGAGRLVFSNANDNHIYEVIGGRIQRIHTHGTYTRDVEFDPQGRLYFSESTGAGGNGRIYRIWAGRVDLQMEVDLDDVDGSWAGDFAFAPDNTIWLSSGNRRPANLYEVHQGRPVLRFVAPTPIKGFAFLDADTIVYADWSQEVRRLHLPTMTESPVVRLGTTDWLSDVTIAIGAVGSGADLTGPVMGYLVTLSGSPIGSLEEITSEIRICGNPGIFDELSAAQPSLRVARFGAVTAPEAILALSTGACDALLVRDFDRLRDAFGQAAGGLVEIEIRGR